MTRPAPESDVLHVFFIEDADLVVAHSAEEAEHLWRESDRDEFTLANYPAPTVKQWPDDKPFTINYEDAPKGSEKQRRTCGEWARESGPGFLASTEW
jgi:hypothetical protein